MTDETETFGETYSEQNPSQTVNPKKHKLLKVLLIIMTVLLLLTVASIAYFFQPWTRFINKDQNILPTAITSKIDFPIYYFEKSPPEGMNLDQASVNYSAGLLVYKLTNADGSRSVTITEQRLPASLQNSTIQGKETVDGTAGNATISFDSTRVIGYLISKDKKTFVVINSTANGSAELVKNLMRSLRPVKY